MKRNDWILIAAVAAAALIGFAALWFAGNPEAGYITVKMDGKVQGTYSLAKDQTVDIKQKNTLVIKDKEAWISDADCPDKVCVNHKAVSKKGESIICLPNKVVVEVTEGKTGELDAITN